MNRSLVLPALKPPILTLLPSFQLFYELREQIAHKHECFLNKGRDVWNGSSGVAC